MQWTPNYYNFTQYYAQLPAPNRSHQLGKHTIQQTSPLINIEYFNIESDTLVTQPVRFKAELCNPFTFILN